MCCKNASSNVSIGISPLAKAGMWTFNYTLLHPGNDFLRNPVNKAIDRNWVIFADLSMTSISTSAGSSRLRMQTLSWAQLSNVLSGINLQDWSWGTDSSTISAEIPSQDSHPSSYRKFARRRWRGCCATIRSRCAQSNLWRSSCPAVRVQTRLRAADRGIFHRWI